MGGGRTQGLVCAVIWFLNATLSFQSHDPVLQDAPCLFEGVCVRHLLHARHCGLTFNYHVKNILDIISSILPPGVFFPPRSLRNVPINYHHSLLCVHPLASGHAGENNKLEMQLCIRLGRHLAEI